MPASQPASQITWSRFRKARLQTDWKLNECPMILINVCPSRFDWKLNVFPMWLINVFPSRFDGKWNECPIILINVCPYIFDWKLNECPMILINVCPSRFDRKLNECPMRLINVCPLDVPTPPPPCSRFLINSTYYTFRPPPFQPILSRCTHLSPTLFKVFYKFDLLPAPLSAHNVSMYHIPRPC